MMSRKANAMARAVERQFFGGSIRLHILHHASEGRVFGAGLTDELKRHGYAISPGTLYPILHQLERNGYLRSRLQLVEGRHQRTYVATAAGKLALKLSRPRLQALARELFRKERHARQDGNTPKSGSGKGEGYEATKIKESM